MVGLACQGVANSVSLSAFPCIESSADSAYFTHMSLLILLNFEFLLHGLIQVRFCRFMVEQGSLELREGERVIHLLEAYSLVSSSLHGCSWDNYQVYSYLRKLGYIVGRHNVLWTSPKKRPPILGAKLENLSVQFADVKVSDGAQDDKKAREMLTEVNSQSIVSSSETEAGNSTY